MKHRTAQGKMIDMGTLRTKNERVRAVGNMLVNARGDTIDSHDNVIHDNTKRVNQHYMNAVQQRVRQTQPVEQQTQAAAQQPTETVAQQNRPVQKKTQEATGRSKVRPQVDEPEDTTPPDDIDDDIPNPKK